MLSGPITINGETITPEMVRSIERIAKLVDVTQGFGADDSYLYSFRPKAIVTLRDGRVFTVARKF